VYLGFNFGRTAVAEKRKRKHLSGGAKMKAAGRKAIMLGVSPEQYDKLKLAASLEMRPVSQFVTFYALQGAENVIANAKGT
jgi:uncharacterized protein (DUF1778 family)